jgi:hypothetical protein
MAVENIHRISLTPPSEGNVRSYLTPLLTADISTPSTRPSSEEDVEDKLD